ncbi:putative ABC transporter ATP-binding protein [compost metagenome]
MQQKPNLLLLDEPTNHLDIDSREALEEALLDYSGSLLAISHDRYFINKIGNQVWALEQKKLIVTHGNYNDYEHEAAKRRALQAEVVVSSMTSSSVVKESKQQHAQQKKSDLGATAKSEKADQQQLERQIRMTEQELAGINEAMHDDTLASDTNTLMELHTQKEQLEEKLEQLLTAYVELS